MAGSTGEEKVVGVVECVGDLGARGAVPVGVGAMGEQLGDGAVGRRDRRALREAGSQGPGQQRQYEHPEPAETQQDRCGPPVAGERKSRTDHRVEEQQQSEDEATVPIVEIIPDIRATAVRVATVTQPLS